MTLGGAPEGATVGESYSQSLSANYDQWWTVRLYDVEYDGNSIKDSGLGYAILDTGTSLLYLGKEDYENF